MVGHAWGYTAVGHAWGHTVVGHAWGHAVVGHAWGYTVGGSVIGAASTANSEWHMESQFGAHLNDGEPVRCLAKGCGLS